MNVLESVELPKILETAAARFAKSYQIVASFLKRMDLPFIPCNAGPSILAKIAPHAQSWEDEAAMIQKLKDAGVWVSPGRSHHMPETAKRWARITFALASTTIEKGLERAERVLKG